MKTTDLIAQLNNCILRWGDQEVWMDSDILVKVTAVEVWHEPHLAEPAIVILGEGAFSAPQG